ncbi:hypothetical protein BXT84_00430 [Sulfobacillus thermotolerans]|uniref:Uncharacterized protein n=1 Tax=Sulfobacillus thermotolerans TaxID=338644 RepID=A0ABN5GVT0_9FIRM|nr:hypothetical protein BXT84_00430 [Sulfobacillus thermotolerans]
MATVSHAVVQLRNRVCPFLQPSSWVLSRSPYVCEAIQATPAPMNGLRVQFAHDILPASHRLIFFIPATMVTTHPDDDFDDWVQIMRSELDSSHHQSQWLYDPGTDGMWVNIAGFLHERPRRQVRPLVAGQGGQTVTLADPILASACAELRQALTAGWGTARSRNMEDSSILLEDVTVTTTPKEGVVVTLWYANIPGTHWLRIIVPKEIIMVSELWDQFPLQLDEDVRTYGHRDRWQFDPDTGGMQFIWT